MTRIPSQRSPEPLPLPHDPWELLCSLGVGKRVVVRYTLEEPGDGPRLSDALGEIVGYEENTVTILTRKGRRTIQRARVRAAKAVPPSLERTRTAKRASENG